ncbi:MAG: cold shock domain-containing protein [Promethearchaeota archaeon]|jgi:CspA family cold shock protein|nr:MAG: cold shock domain-containing protein [Candidatus Lokiarchaeota archaeon]
MTESVEIGRVKWFSSKKGYGFIIRNPEEPEESQEEIFVHFKQIVMDGFKTLLPGLKVEYEVGPGQKDNTVEAKNVRIVT